MIVLPAKINSTTYFADKFYLEDMRTLAYSTWLREHGAEWDPINSTITFMNDHDYTIFKLKYNV